MSHTDSPLLPSLLAMLHCMHAQSSHLVEEWKSQIGLLEEDIGRCKELEKQLKAEMRRKSDAALELMRKKDEEIDRLRVKVGEAEEALRATAATAAAAVPPEQTKSSSSSSLFDQTEEQVSHSSSVVLEIVASCSMLI